ncbi:MAG: hypothetical protein HYR85_00495 [Planctomycetes bacterium]|nr:hypothetical protein [Planctomycetota bacterium]MBI3847535.1 hypothetical protein [Planctomycetota bacterium]
MKGIRLAPVALIAALIALPACQATKAVTEPITSAAAGFGEALGLQSSDIENAILPATGGFQVIQNRQRFRNPRTEREAIDELRARRQTLLRQIH